jgi:uncharacterized hydrophobic protein (TIGR00271 family)
MYRLLRFILRPDFQRVLRIDPKSKPKVYLQIFQGADVNNLNYWIELFLSTGIATLGLILNSPAVVIGAMLISPLMGPIIGSGLSLASADFYLFLRSATQLVLSIIGVVLFAALIVWLLPFDAATDEIIARTRPNLLDLGVALFSGLAGALILARVHSPQGGGVSALPGVAVAVALLPPLCALGFGVGVGFDPEITQGAALLFTTNLVAIIASAFLVFFAIRMDTAEVRATVAPKILELAEKDPIFHLLESRIEMVQVISAAGKLRWRVLALVVLLAAVAVPLSQALYQVTRELRARDAVNTAIREMGLTRDTIISRQTNLGRDNAPIGLRLIVTEEVNPETVAAAERSILRRTGREASVRVRRVADESELRRLTSRTTRQADFPADLETLRADLTDRVRRPLTELWPHTIAFLRNFEISFGPEATTVRVEYESDQDMEESAATILQGGLRRLLGAPDLKLDLQRDRGTGFLEEAEPESALPAGEEVPGDADVGAADPAP